MALVEATEVELQASPRRDPEDIEIAAIDLDEAITGAVLDLGVCFSHETLVFRIGGIEPDSPATVGAGTLVTVVYGKDQHFKGVGPEDVVPLSELCEPSQRKTASAPVAVKKKAAPAKRSKAASDDVLFPVRVASKKYPKGRWGFINRKGKLVIKAQFGAVCSDDFVCGMVLVQDLGGSFRFMERDGTCRFHYREVRPFSEEGLAAVRLNYRTWGFIDTNGKLVIEDIYEHVLPFSEGLAGVKIDGKYGFIDTKGQQVITPKYPFADSFSEGRAEVGTPTVARWEKRGYIDREGRLVIRRKYSSGDPFSEGLAAVSKGKRDLHGYIDSEGMEIIGHRFRGAGAFRDGLAAATLDYKQWGFIDRSGKWAIEPKFALPPTSACGFSEGMCGIGLADDRKLEGYIDRNGEWAIDPRFEKVSDFKHGLASVTLDGKRAVINTDGNVIWMNKLPVDP